MLHKLNKLCSIFYRAAQTSGRLSEVFSNIKDVGKITYNGYEFKFFDFCLASDDDIPGEFAVFFYKFKDRSSIIQYDLVKDLLEVFGTRKVPIIKINKPTTNDLDKLFKDFEEEKDIDNKSIVSEYRDLNIEEGNGLVYRKPGIEYATNLLEILNTNGIKLEHGQMLGAGAEGEIYEYGNDKIIKIFLLQEENRGKVFGFLNKIKNKETECLPKIFDFGSLLRIGQKTIVGLPKFDSPLWISYYIAEKMEPIKEELDVDKVEILYEKLKSLGLTPWDIDNKDNIMKDKNGNYIFVDIGSYADFI